MPSEKRARQRAGKLQRRTARARKAKARKLLRNSAIVVVVAAVVIAVVITTRGHSPSSPPAKGTAGKGSASTVTTLTTAPAGSPAAEQAAANRAATAAGCPAGTTARVNTLHWSSPPAMAIDPQKAYSATFKTTAGTFAVSLLAKTAPKTVNSFVFLAKTGYFHCVTFHRVVTGFVDQTGDPTGTGTGSPGYHFANENVPASYAAGDVAMANSGGTDSNGSQFFVVVPGGDKVLDGDLSSGDAYSLFGTVTSGMPVVEKINSEGSADGKPAVVQRVLSVTVSQS